MTGIHTMVVDDQAEFFGVENSSPELTNDSSTSSVDAMDDALEIGNEDDESEDEGSENEDEGSGIAGFHMGPKGLYREMPTSKKDGDTVKVWVAAPFKVMGLASDSQKSNPALLISFSVDGREKEVMQSTADLFSPLDLARKMDFHGLMIGPRCKEHFAEYLGLVRRGAKHTYHITYSCGWQVCDVYMMPDGTTYGTNGELVRPSIELQGSLVAQSIGGTIEGQQEAMKLARRNPWFQFCACVALAGPLVKLVGGRSAGIHIWSKSSRGKSIAAELAASVWHNPSPLQNWRSTSNALENLAIRHNDGFMALDEIQTVVSAEALDEASYVLANGKQKARLRADSALKRIQSWAIAYLSTGEYDYATALRKKSGNRIQQAQSGQEVRLISVHTPETDMGLVSDFATHGFGSSKEYVERVQALTRANYGHLARAYVQTLSEAILKDPEGYRAYLVRTMDEWKSKVESGGNQVNRVLDSFALVACAGKQATEMRLLPWEKNDAFEAAWLAYGAYLEGRGSSIDGEDLKLMRAIFRTVQVDSNRFASREQHLKDVPRCLGRIVYLDPGMRSEKIYAYDFTSEGLQEVCGCGIDRILTTLKAQRWLALPDKGNSFHTTLNGNQWRFYRLLHEKIQEFERSLDPTDGEDEAEPEAAEPEPEVEATLL